jgi:hypothetical protein
LKFEDEIKGQKIEMRLRNELNSGQHFPGRTHPGTERCTMRRGIVVRVLAGVLGQLRIGKAAEQYQPARQPALQRRIVA